MAFDSKTIVERHVNSLLFGNFIRNQENENRGLNVKMNIEKFFYENNPTIGQSFLSWLENIDSLAYQKQLKNLVKNTPLSKQSADELIYKVSKNFKKIIIENRNLKEGYDLKLEALKKEFGDASPAYKAVSYRKSQFFTEICIELFS